MAGEQDFEIKIRINADTSQVETIRRSFERLGAQVQVTNQQVAAAGAAGAGGLGTIIGAATGFGIAGSIQALVSGLQNASRDIEKVAQSLNEQGEQLLKNAQLFEVQAKHAQDEADVIKISENALKQIETTQKTLNDLQQKQLGMAEQFSDYLQKQMLARQRLAQMGDYEAARQENINTAESQAAAARAAAIREIDDAQNAQNRTNDEVISDLEKSIELEQKRSDTARTNNDPVELLKAVKALNQYNQELDKAIQKREALNKAGKAEARANEAEREKDVDFVQEQVQKASPQVRRILMNEQAAQLARDQGREREADMFQKSAESFRRSATPQQQAEAGVLEKLIEQNGLLREIRDSWR